MGDDVLTVDGVIGLLLADFLDSLEHLLELVAPDSQCVVTLLNLKLADELEFLLEKHHEAT